MLKRKLRHPTALALALYTVFSCAVTASAATVNNNIKVRVNGLLYYDVNLSSVYRAPN